MTAETADDDLVRANDGRFGDDGREEMMAEAGSMDKTRVEGRG